MFSFLLIMDSPVFQIEGEFFYLFVMVAILLSCLYPSITKATMYGDIVNVKRFHSLKP